MKKIRITHPIADVPEIQAGHVVEVSDILAEIWIANDWAIEVIEEPKPKKEKVKHGDG